ncbi:MAG: DUF1330 domain-containing protein [Alphaproteobacteria bacterium]|nr:DUF1330 domain-containing protein [Alphaproteobacteria bacterium]
MPAAPPPAYEIILKEIRSMPGYVILQINVTDAETYAEYGRRATPTLEPFGGEFVVGGEAKVREGTWPWPRLVVLRFPSIEKANEWYESDAYRPLIELRQKSADSNVVFVEGK